MYDYRLVSAYMSLHMTSSERRAQTAHRPRRIYQLLAERRTPRNDRSR